MPHNNLSDQEIRLEILRLVKETGSEVQKNNLVTTTTTSVSQAACLTSKP